MSALLVEYARRIEAARHGEAGGIYDELAATLGVSSATARVRLKPFLVEKERKRRADAGRFTLSRDEAVLIAATIEASRRQTGTGELPLEIAVDILRANGRIDAGRVDRDTGEFIPLSLSAIATAMRHYGVHPGQLSDDTPATRMSSPHPNWCWQIDASVSRQFYLSDDGARIMDRATFYRGKPQNFTAIESQRIWRYAVTDHCAGPIEPFYVLGAESAMNLLTALMHVMTQRPDGTMYGVPRYLKMDPGSAPRSGPVRNFCEALGIEILSNEQGNSRANGQVENAHLIIERHFEAALKFRAPVQSIAEINDLARPWAYSFNATRVHSRTGVTRRDGWLRITPEQLRLAPTIDVLRTLAMSMPKECTVRDWMIRFKGERYDVRGLPHVLNGSKLMVRTNAFDPKGSVRVETTDAEGRRAHFLAPIIGRDDWGFDATAAQIGTEFRGVPETPADAARKELERTAMVARTQAEADEKRKRKALPFDGAIDPSKAWSDRNANVPRALPRAGTPMQVEAPAVLAPQREVRPLAPAAELPVFTGFELVKLLKIRVEERGLAWNPDWWGVVAQRWPNGLTEEQLDAAAGSLLTPNLRAIAGGAA